MIGLLGNKKVYIDNEFRFDMKKDYKVIFLSVIFLLTVFSFVSFVNAQAPTTAPAGGTTVGDDVSSFFGKLLGGAGATFFKGDAFARILLFLLVALVVYAISDWLPFMAGRSKTAINTAIAIVIGLLATFYLSETEIATIILSYSALGIFITLVVPFFVVAAIQVKSYEHGQHWATKQLWLFYIVIVGIKWWSATSEKIGLFGKWLYPLLAILALFLYVFESPILRRVIGEKVRDKVENYKRRREVSNRVITADYVAANENVDEHSNL